MIPFFERIFFRAKEMHSSRVCFNVCYNCPYCTSSSAIYYYKHEMIKWSKMNQAKRTDPSTLLADSKKCWTLFGQNSLSVKSKVYSVCGGRNYRILPYSSSKIYNYSRYTSFIYWALYPLFNSRVNRYKSWPNSTAILERKGKCWLKKGMNSPKEGQNSNRAYLTRLYFINHSWMRYSYSWSYFDALGCLCSSRHNFCR